MKNARRFAAMAATMALALCAVAPVASFTASADGNASIEITGLDASVKRTFEVYQVFTGTYDSTGKTFSNLKWGSGVTKYNNKAVTANTLVDDTIIDSLSDNARDIVSKLEFGTVTKTVNSDSASITIDGLDDGYYVIKDVTNLNGKNDANSAWIVQVAAESANTSITIKKDTPTVDKQIQDETYDAEVGADSEGYGESADHAINEQFNFKLIATIPKNSNLTAYDAYKITFEDAMSAGVTFDEITSVKIKSETTLTRENEITLTASQYSVNGTDVDNKAGLSWTLSIEDVKALVNNNKLGTDEAAVEIFGEEEIKVEVIYKAHLNENAIVDKQSRNTGESNNNTIKLKYSNNPDSTGTGTNSEGETPEDYVWAFTYRVDNIKKQISENGSPLAGAKFQIKSGNTVIKLIDNKNGTYTVADQSAILTADTELASTGKPIVDTMVSAGTTGIFNIIGLDAGTYTLVETDAPEGFNRANDTTITIKATHKENEAGNMAVLTISNDSTMDNTVVDTRNTTLPSTGGIGTTLFVMGGGCTAALAGIYLISKKRAKDEESE